MKKYNCIILDIDGVLNNYETRKNKEIAEFHSRIFSNEEFTKDGFNFDQQCLDALNLLISSLSNPKIVISSNWRYHATANHFHAMFNVVGVLYTPIDLIEGVENDALPEFKRSSLIMNYIKAHNDIASWCAIDDRKDLYVKNFTQIVFTNPHTGLTKDDAQTFLHKIFHDDKSTST